MTGLDIIAEYQTISQYSTHNISELQRFEKTELTTPTTAASKQCRARDDERLDSFETCKKVKFSHNRPVQAQRVLGS